MNFNDVNYSACGHQSDIPLHSYPKHAAKPQRKTFNSIFGRDSFRTPNEYGNHHPYNNEHSNFDQMRTSSVTSESHTTTNTPHHSCIDFNRSPDHISLIPSQQPNEGATMMNKHDTTRNNATADVNIGVQYVDHCLNQENNQDNNQPEHPIMTYADGQREASSEPLHEHVFDSDTATGNSATAARARRKKIIQSKRSRSNVSKANNTNDPKKKTVLPSKRYSVTNADFIKFKNKLVGKSRRKEVLYDNLVQQFQKHMNGNEMEKVHEIIDENTSPNNPKWMMSGTPKFKKECKAFLVAYLETNGIQKYNELCSETNGVSVSHVEDDKEELEPENNEHTVNNDSDDTMYVKTPTNIHKEENTTEDSNHSLHELESVSQKHHSANNVPNYYTHSVDFPPAPSSSEPLEPVEPCVKMELSGTLRTAGNTTYEQPSIDFLNHTIAALRSELEACKMELHMSNSKLNTARVHIRDTIEQFRHGFGIISQIHDALE